MQGVRGYVRDHYDGILLPYLTLSLFCGVRSTESLLLDWDAINLDQRVVTLGAKIAKKRSRRTVEIPVNAVAWFKRCKDQPICAPRRVLDTAKRAAGYAIRECESGGLPTWPASVLRHTAISYRLAQTGDEARTTAWAGNSPDVIHEYYKDLVTPAATDMFWSLSPETV